MDIKILVAVHKKYWMPDNSVFLPIQVVARSASGIGIYSG